MDFTKLQSELTSDPATLGYAGLNDTLAAAKLNATNTGRSQARRSVSKNELLAAIVDAEWPITALSQNKLLCIFACDTIDASSPNVKGIFQAIFSAGATRTNLLALGARVVSRADELGLGDVTPNDVKLARSGVW